jgi:hypothetical protein
LATKDGQCRQTNDERNFAGRRGNDEDAPKPDLTAVASGLPHPTLLGHSASHSERLFLPDTVEEVWFEVIAATRIGSCVTWMSAGAPQVAAIGAGIGISLASLRRF